MPCVASSKFVRCRSRQSSGWREEATPARFYHLARVGQRTADFLRSVRLYRLVNMAKRTGLRRFVFGGGSPLPPMDPARAAELRRLLSPEVTRLEAIIDRDLGAWKT